MFEDYIEIDDTQRENTRTRGGRVIKTAYAPGGLWGISIFHLILTELFCLILYDIFLRIVCRLVWTITVVDDSISKQFSEEKGDQMAVLPATVGGLSVDIPVGTVRRALAIAELSGSDTVSVTISLERLVDLTQTVAGLVGQQLNEVAGQEKMSSDVETR